MPLICINQYINRAPVFEIAKVTAKTATAGSIGYIRGGGNSFYNLNGISGGSTSSSGKVSSTTDASLGFGTVSTTSLPTYLNYGFAKNINSGRLFMIPTDNPNVNSSQSVRSDDDGHTWTNSFLPVGAFWHSIESDSNGTVMAVSNLQSGNRTLNTAISVNDGNTWTSISAKAGGGDHIKYIPRLNIWIITNRANDLRYSKDGGATWGTGTSLNPGSFTNPTINIVDTGSMLVLGMPRSSNYLMTSTDGINWAPMANVPDGPFYSGSTHVLAGMEYANGLFVCVFGATTIYTTTDFVTWTPLLMPASYSPSTVAYANNQLVFGSGYQSSKYYYYQF